MRIYSLFIIRKIQFKIAMKSYNICTMTNILKIKKKHNNCWRRSGAARTLYITGGDETHR